jgi:hypothetical protein
MKTKEEIENIATSRINYLRQKGGWRGFIEGALWMQEQTKELQGQLAEKEKECKTLKNERDFNFKEFCRIKDLYYESQGIINTTK